MYTVNKLWNKITEEDTVWMCDDNNILIINISKINIASNNFFHTFSFTFYHAIHIPVPPKNLILCRFFFTDKRPSPLRGAPATDN